MVALETVEGINENKWFTSPQILLINALKKYYLFKKYQIQLRYVLDLPLTVLVKALRNLGAITFSIISLHRHF